MGRTKSVPERWSSTRPDEQFRKLAHAVNALLRGESNNARQVTLRPNATTTEVAYSSARSGALALLSPLSASAAASQLQVFAVCSDGRVTVNHDSSPATDRIFALAVVG